MAKKSHEFVCWYWYGVKFMGGIYGDDTMGYHSVLGDIEGLTFTTVEDAKKYLDGKAESYGYVLPMHELPKR